MQKKISLVACGILATTTLLLVKAEPASTDYRSKIKIIEQRTNEDYINLIPNYLTLVENKPCVDN